MREHNLAFIDIETSGLSVIEHEILEIGCVITNHKLKVLSKFEIKIKPEHIENADSISLKINHYNKEDWEGGKTLKEALNIFSKEVKDCIMVGQNVAFDSGFLEYHLEKNNVEKTLHYHRLDTISIAWAKLHNDPEISHFSLREMCKYFDIENKKPHSALADAFATFELYKKLISL